MEKTTILAKIRVSMEFSEEAYGWLREISERNIWFAKEEGIPFFAEFRGWWKKALISSSEPIIQDYFLELGLPKEKLPRIKFYESYPGSWIMEAVLLFAGAVTIAHSILKGLSELPEIADGIMKLKERLKQAFTKEANQKATEALTTQAKQNNLPPPPPNPIRTDYVIDARPITALTHAPIKSHKLHMGIAISRDTFTLENLGKESLRDIRLGIFKSEAKKHQWTYEESYKGQIGILSSNQTIAKDLDEFRNTDGESLDLSGNESFYIDCWVEDKHGIYLFMFYLEQ